MALPPAAEPPGTLPLPSAGEALSPSAGEPPAALVPLSLNSKLTVRSPNHVAPVMVPVSATPTASV